MRRVVLILALMAVVVVFAVGVVFATPPNLDHRRSMGNLRPTPPTTNRTRRGPSHPGMHGRYGPRPSYGHPYYGRAPQVIVPPPRVYPYYPYRYPGNYGPYYPPGYGLGFRSGFGFQFRGSGVGFSFQL